MGDMLAVAIDGPAGAGKSSVARRVAEAKGWLFVDSGAMYRAFTLKALRLGVDLADADALAGALRDSALAFDASGTRIALDGEDVSAAIRDPKVTENIRHIARIPALREILVDRQRAIARTRPVVMEGRDIGTAALPEAKWKFFLTAPVAERARRRFDELAATGRGVALEDVVRDLAARDEADFAVGPLKDARDRALAGDGIAYLDTGGMGLEEAAAAVLSRIDGSNI
ncbi:MAG: (d)CMP kinase [Planctomycetota bacterium]|jgi:cytidylate kinase|nr:(d)CMP kinase [Planctomycetota bacterium]